MNAGSNQESAAIQRFVIMIMKLFSPLWVPSLSHERPEVFFLDAYEHRFWRKGYEELKRGGRKGVAKALIELSRLRIN